MIRCGSCKGQHSTADQVRDCYKVPAMAGAPTPTNPAAPAARPFVTNAATEKQVTFIETLCQERNRRVPTGLSKPEASALITELLATPKVKGSAGVAIAATAAQQLDGTYTVVAEDGDWTTVRFRDATWAKDLPAGSKVVEYLSGSDNEVDYTGFAFLVNGRARIWGKFKNGDSAPVRALAGLITAADDSLNACHEAFLQLAEGYALRSGNCMRCGHKLTVPQSLHRGLGPICAAAEGV